MSSDERLGERAERVFERADQGDEVIFVPSIVVAESVYVADAHGYEVEMEAVVDDLNFSRNYVMEDMGYPVVRKLVSDSRDLSIHDKIIVLMAENLGADILSKNIEINDLAEVDVIW